MKFVTLPEKKRLTNPKKSFSSVYIIDTTCFDEWDIIFYIFHIVTQRFGETTMFLPSLRQAFWKKSTFFYTLSPQ